MARKKLKITKSLRPIPLDQATYGEKAMAITFCNVIDFGGITYQEVSPRYKLLVDAELKRRGKEYLIVPDTAE